MRRNAEWACQMGVATMPPETLENTGTKCQDCQQFWVMTWVMGYFYITKIMQLFIYNYLKQMYLVLFPKI